MSMECTFTLYHFFCVRLTGLTWNQGKMIKLIIFYTNNVCLCKKNCSAMRLYLEQNANLIFVFCLQITLMKMLFKLSKLVFSWRMHIARFLFLFVVVVILCLILFLFKFKRHQVHVMTRNSDTNLYSRNSAFSCPFQVLLNVLIVTDPLLWVPIGLPASLTNVVHRWAALVAGRLH